MYNRDELFRRIDINPKIMAGKPIIKGTRIAVGQILGLLAEGRPFSQILAEYDHITADDIAACLLFAQETLERLIFMPAAPND